MLNNTISILKYKLTTGWTQKWYYWAYLNLIIGVSFIIFGYSVWFLYPTSLFDALVYIIFFWLGLILTPIYWCILWVIFILYIFGIKVPFFFYPLGTGLLACRIGLILLYSYIIFIPLKYLSFKIFKFFYNFFIEFLLSLVSLYKKIQKQHQKYVKYKKIYFIFKEWVRDLFIKNMLEFQEKFPSYFMIRYIKIYKFFQKYYIFIIFGFFIIRIFYFIKLKILVFLFKTNLYKLSNKYYLTFIAKNILIIQKTQYRNPEIELIILNKKFLKIFKDLNIRPRLLSSNEGYYLRIKQQKLYITLYGTKKKKQ